jgi:hypothetical protein
MKFMRTLAIAMIAAPLLMACGDDDSTGVDLTMSSVAGTYTASSAKSGSSLTAVEGGITINALQLGATLTLTLNADGTSTGTFHIPASISDSGTDENESLTGTWTLNGTQVTLTQSGDTFLRGIKLTANGHTLTATDTSDDGVTISAVLVK